MTGRRPARVLWLIKGLGRGGAERLLSLSVPHLRRDRYQVEVAYLLPHKRALVGEIAGRGIPVHCLGGRLGADPSWVWRLRRLLRTGAFDLVHTHSPYPAVAARLLAGRRGPLVVHTEHNVWPRYRLPTFAANAATYGRNRAVIAVSDGVADSITPPRWARRVRMPPLEVLHHGIDESAVRSGPAARTAARNRLSLDDGDLVLGTVANFTPKKDQGTLLDAFGRLAAERPRLRLVLVGSGPCEQDLRDRVHRSGLTDRVLFTGSRDDVQEILPAFDIFVLSSLHEGLSIALIEAMAAGLACVATAVGGVPEVISDGRDGLLVPSQDAAALATAIERLLRDPALRSDIGAAARQTSAHFSITAAVRRLEVIYDEVLAQAARWPVAPPERVVAR